MKASTWCQQPSSWHFLLCCADTPYPKFKPSYQELLRRVLVRVASLGFVCPSFVLASFKVQY